MKELEIILSTLEDLSNPKPELEQWTTPARIAAEILLYADSRGDVKGKTCADFGCGNGILAIGLALLGAKVVYAIDIDPEAIATARKNADTLEKAYGGLPIVFIVGDVRTINLKCDTVVMNPPFGLDRHTKHMDRLFLEKAFSSATAVYSIHHSSRGSRRFLCQLAEQYSFSCEHICSFCFPLRTRFWYHRRKVKNILVDFFSFHKQ